MGAVVVIQPPAVNDPLGLGQAQEQFPVEQLVSQPAIERFHLGIANDWAGRKENGSVRPMLEVPGNGLRTSIWRDSYHHIVLDE